jgi:hypothetical protein
MARERSNSTGILRDASFGKCANVQLLLQVPRPERAFQLRPAYNAAGFPV